MRNLRLSDYDKQVLDYLPKVKKDYEGSWEQEIRHTLEDQGIAMSKRSVHPFKFSYPKAIHYHKRLAKKFNNRYQLKLAHRLEKTYQAKQADLD